MPRAAITHPVAVRVLDRHGGVAHLQRFLEAGLSRGDVAHLLHLGLLIRPRKGWYADRDLPMIGVRAARVGGAAGCVSAAATWGLVVPEHAAECAHVSLVPGQSRLRHSRSGGRAGAGDEPGVRWHWERRLDSAVGWRVSALDALLQMASCVEFRWLVAAIDSARCTAQGPATMTASDMRSLRAALPDTRRAAVDRSDPRSETSGETFVRLGLEDRRVPYVPQQRLTTAYRPDGTVDGWLPIEVDGLTTHATREGVIRDRERDAVIARLGTPPLRFTQTQAVRDTDWVCDVIEAVWRRGRADRPRRSAGDARHTVVLGR